MMVEVDIVEAICRRGCGDMQTCDDLTKMGLMRFSGNQWNEDWDFVREKVEKLSDEKKKVLWELVNLRREYGNDE